jgi:hypothetical protein
MMLSHYNIIGRTGSSYTDILSCYWALVPVMYYMHLVINIFVITSSAEVVRQGFTTALLFNEPCKFIVVYLYALVPVSLDIIERFQQVSGSSLMHASMIDEYVLNAERWG